MKNLKYLLFIACLVLLILSVYPQSPILNISFDLRNTTPSASVNISNRPINYHVFNWSVQQGSLSACTVAFESSGDNSTWTSQGTGNCTSSGNSTPLNFVANFVRVHATTFTAIAGPAPVVTVNYSNYTTGPATVNSDGSFTALTPIKVSAAGGKYLSMAHDGTNGTISLGGTGILNLGSTNNVSKLVTSLGVPGFSNSGESWIDCQGTAGVGAGRNCRLVTNDNATLNIQNIGKSFTYSDRQTGLTGAYNSGNFTCSTVQDSTYYISTYVKITAGNNYSFYINLSFTDETNTGQTQRLFNTFNASPYSDYNITVGYAATAFIGSPIFFRCKSGTNMSVTTVAIGNFTNVTYNIQSIFTQIN